LPNLGGDYIAVTDSAGQQRLTTLRPFGDTAPPAAPSARTRRVLENGQPAISDFVVAPDIGRSVVTLEVPVFSNGKVVYSLSMGIFGERLGDILRRQNLPADWITAILDGNGTIAARNHLAEQFVGGRASARFLHRSAALAEGATDTASLEGTPVLRAFNRSSRSGWVVVIGIPNVNLTGNLWRSLGFNAALALVLLALSIWVAKIVSVRINRTIDSLHVPALAPETPELAAIPDHGFGEISNIGQALMKASLMTSAREMQGGPGEWVAQENVLTKRTADTTSQAKSELLASMSHDLRTPLKVLDCLEVMAEASRTLEVSAADKGVVFKVDTSGNLPSVVADRGRLLEVLLNLGSNAIKHTVEGGWVLLSALAYDGCVRFMVRDTGKGIPAERQQEIFEPSRRFVVEPGHQGSSIGLTVSRRLVQAMDGRIGFESSVGHGSKFWVELPVANETAAKMARVPSLFAAAADTRCKILYIKEKIPNVELLRAIIEDLSHTRFIDAQTVREGLRMAPCLRPDLVITDIHLPDGKGFDVLRGLRNDERTAQIPVIALTDDALPSNMHNVELAAFDHILTKPLQIPDLMNILRATLKAA
jgi:signal transduction histidine kinase